MDSFDEILDQFVEQGYDDSLVNFDFIRNAVAEDGYDLYADIGINPNSIDYSPSTVTNSDIESMVTGGSGGVLDSMSGLLKSGSNLINKNKTAAEIIAGAIGNAYKAKQSKEAIEAQEKKEKDKRDRINASILGMKTPSPGLISSSLTRMDGSPVYQSKGRFA